MEAIASMRISTSVFFVHAVPPNHDPIFLQKHENVLPVSMSDPPDVPKSLPMASTSRWFAAWRKRSTESCAATGATAEGPDREEHDAASSEGTTGPTSFPRER